MNDFATVNYSVHNRVATIRLNRPKAMNSFTSQMRKDLQAAVDRANSDTDVRVVVLGGEGRAFCAGADLTEDFHPEFATVEAQIKDSYKPLLLAIHNSEKLFIASVKGAAAGAGCALALTCDLVIMAENAYLYQAFSAIALVPDCGASWHFVNQLGSKRALQMIVEAEKLPAASCLELGFANRVEAVDELDAATQAWAEKLASGAPLAQRYIKQIVNRVPQMSLAQTIDLEAELQNETIASKDFVEGTTAFFAKRPARFTGE